MGDDILTTKCALGKNVKSTGQSTCFDKKTLVCLIKELDNSDTSFRKNIESLSEKELEEIFFKIVCNKAKCNIEELEQLALNSSLHRLISAINIYYKINKTTTRERWPLNNAEIDMILKQIHMN